MWRWIPAGLVLLFAAAGAQAQNFAFLNTKEAASACDTLDAPQRAQAIGLANTALTRLPHAMIHLRTAGLLPHQGIRDESESAARDFPAARDLAVGYCVSRRPEYRTHALTILEEWLIHYRPSYNAMDERVLVPLYLAADILRGTFQQPTENAWQSFNEDMAHHYLAEADSAQSADNVQSERIMLASLAAFSTGDSGLIGHAESVYTTQLSGNISSGGVTADYTRHDALRAVVSDLTPLATAALAAHDHGQNWYGIAASTGASLPEALAWLAPYASGAKVHQEYASSRDQFDYARHNAGEPGFSGTWSPSSAAELYLMAAGLDRQWSQLATNLGAHPAVWQRMMLGMP